VPFGFLRRRSSGRPSGSGAPTGPTVAGGSGVIEPPSQAQVEAELLNIRLGRVRPVGFTALTEDWRLQGNMQIRARLSDALNKREAITITDVSWGPPDAKELVPAPGLKSVDPYDLIMVAAGADSLPPLTDAEKALVMVDKVPCDVSLEVPPFRVAGTVFLNADVSPESLLVRSQEMFLPVCDAVVTLDGAIIGAPDVDVILVNRRYLRGVALFDRETGQVVERPAPPPRSGNRGDS